MIVVRAVLARTERTLLKINEPKSPKIDQTTSGGRHKPKTKRKQQQRS
jgi:hypothetical protein